MNEIFGDIAMHFVLWNQVFAELEIQKGPLCLWHHTECMVSVLLLLSTLRFCMWLKHPLPKGTCPDFEVLEDSVTVWGTVPLCGKQSQHLTAGVIWSLPLLSIVGSDFQLLNERSCMYLELETCSRGCWSHATLLFGWLNRKKDDSQSKYTTSVGQDQGKAVSLFCSFMSPSEMYSYQLSLIKK